MGHEQEIFVAGKFSFNGINSRLWGLKKDPSGYGTDGRVFSVEELRGHARNVSGP